MPDLSNLKIRTDDDIEWHCERQGTGPNLVLIPSGEGSCESFAKVAALLAASFTVTTFDMPGLARSSAPEQAMKDLTASKLAKQVLGLLDEVSISKATFWGCSSGGVVALTLASEYPNRVQSVIVHEVPLAAEESMLELPAMDEKAIIQACRHWFAHIMCEDAKKWSALGPVYHERLDRDCVIWARNYIGQVERSFTREELTRRPVTWTIGALTPAGMFFQNVVDGFAAGIKVGLLPSRHFPQVTIPEKMAGHVREAAGRYL